MQDDLDPGEGDNSTAANLQPLSSFEESNRGIASQPSTSQLGSQPVSPSNVRLPSSSESDSDSGSSEEEGEGSTAKGENSVDEELSKLVGMKCCAPFSHDWGKLDYHNALVMSAVRDSQTDKILVRPIFIL